MRSGRTADPASRTEAKIPDSGQSEAELGVGPRSDRRRQRLRLGESDLGGVEFAGDMSGFGPAAKQHAEAQSIGHRAEQSFAGIEAGARLVDPGLEIGRAHV